VRISVALGTVALVACVGAYAADSGMPVYVAGTADDAVGERLVYAVKETIRKSGGLSLQASTQDAFLAVNMVTLDPDDNGSRTVYSFVLTSADSDESHFDYELSFVGVCGTDRVVQCAERIVASVDSVSERYKKSVADALRNQPTKQDAVN